MDGFGRFLLAGLRNFLWNLMLFVSHTRPRRTGCQAAPTGGRLLVSLHRNGMLDIFAFRPLWPGVQGLISVQWHQNPFLRTFIGGIPVTRAKDRHHSVKTDNAQALQDCADFIRGGGSVIIAPEGSSQLGPGHLPFQKGAARVAAKALETMSELRIVPISPVYLEGWTFRSPVEFYFGPELCFTPEATMNQIHQEICRALEAITLRADDAADLLARQRTAWELRLLTGRPFSEILLESPEESLKAAVKEHRAFHEQIPKGALPCGAADFSAISPWLNRLVFFLFNLICLPPRVLAWPALALSRRLRRPLVDDLNVAALWRALIALPLVTGWQILLAFLFSCLIFPVLGLFYILWSMAALLLEPARRRFVAREALFRSVGPEALAAYGERLASCLTREGSPR